MHRRIVLRCLWTLNSKWNETENEIIKIHWFKVNPFHTQNSHSQSNQWLNVDFDLDSESLAMPWRPQIKCVFFLFLSRSPPVELWYDFAVDCADVMYCDAVAEWWRMHTPHTHSLSQSQTYPLNKNRILEFHGWISIFEFRIDFCDWNEFIVLHASHHFEFPLECDPNTNQI